MSSIAALWTLDALLPSHTNHTPTFLVPPPPLLLVCLFQGNASNKKPGTLSALFTTVSPMLEHCQIQGLSLVSTWWMQEGWCGAGKLVIVNTRCLDQQMRLRLQKLVRSPRGWAGGIRLCCYRSGLIQGSGSEPASVAKWPQQQGG